MSTANSADIYKQMNNHYDTFSIDSSGVVRNSATGAISKPYIADGHVKVKLKGIYGVKTFQIRNLIAEYFLDKIEGKTWLTPIDGEMLNYSLDNLKYVDEAEFKRLKAYHLKKHRLVTDMKDYIEMDVEKEESVGYFYMNNNGKIYSFKSNKFLKHTTLSSGICVIQIENGKYKIHDLVAKYFMKPSDADHELIHKDGNKSNNSVFNLEWILIDKNAHIINLDNYIQLMIFNNNYYMNRYGKICNKETNTFISHYIVDGHYNIILRGQNKIRKFQVRNLVAEYFLEKIDGKTFINHKNGNMLDHCADNLEYVSKEELSQITLECLKTKLLDDALKGYVEVIGRNDLKGYYYANEHGTVCSLYGKEILFMEQSSSKDGYCVIKLGSKNDETDGIYQIHVIVAQCFIPRIEGKDYVNHKNGDKTNNHVSNLEWVTASENNLHAIATGLKKMTFILNDFKYHKIKDGNIIETFNSIAEIERKCNDGGRNSQIYRALDDENTFCFGFQWKKEKINHFTNEDEIWMPLKTGTERDKLMEVSDMGRARNAETHHIYAQQGELYKSVNLSVKREIISYLIYRLVAMSFLINECGDGAQVNHIDKNPLNNRLDNLEWISVKDHSLKDHGVPVTEVCADGTTKQFGSLKEAGLAYDIRAQGISKSICTGCRCNKSRWYRTSEYIPK